MPVISKSKLHSFNENFYRDKFNQKKIQIYNSLELNPNDVVLQKQIVFIDKILADRTDELGLGSKINWPEVWNNWEKLVV